MSHKKLLIALILLVALTVGAIGVAAQTGNDPTSSQAALDNGFTYQGYLTDDSDNPVTDTCDFRFQLYDALLSGTQVGADVESIGVDVENGYFTTRINVYDEFGTTAFSGSERYLAVAAKCISDTSYLALGPRQRLSAVPYAVYALTAGSVLSQEDSTFYISPHSLVERGNSGCLDMALQDNGSMMLTMDAGCTPYVSAPVSTFGTLFGSQMYIKAIEVCYKDNNENNVILTTAVIKNDGGEGDAFYILDGTDRSENTRTCYTVNATAPYKPVDNSSWVQFNMENMNPMGSGYDFYLYTIKLTLSQYDN